MGALLQRIRAILADFRASKSGNFGVIFGLALTPVVAAMGVAVDYSVGLNARPVLQGAADSTVLAAASLNSADTNSRIAVAKDTFAANIAAHSSTVSSTPNVSLSGNSVSLTATATISTVVLGVIGVEVMEVAVSAGAIRPSSVGPACVLALDTAKSEAISLKGTADLIATNCAVHTNSTSASALDSVGSSTATADNFCAVGGYSGNNFTPPPITGCLIVQDPLAGLTPPSTAGCDYGDASYKKGSHTAYPGIYCGGMDLRAHADVTLSPGVYVIKDGPLDMASHSSITGTDVTFYLTGDDAVLDIRGGADIDITAPTTGTYAGLAIIQDASTGEGSTSEINGGGTLRIVGGVYLPSQTLEVGGNGTFGAASSFMPLIANSFLFTGNASITVNVDNDIVGMPSYLPMIETGTPRLTN